MAWFIAAYVAETLMCLGFAVRAGRRVSVAADRASGIFNHSPTGRHAAPSGGGMHARVRERTRGSEVGE